MFYIFALERAVESRNRVLENQLLVTVRGREKERKLFEPAVLYFCFPSLERSHRSFVRSLLGSPLSSYVASSFASRKGTRGALASSEDALRNGDKVCNDDYFGETSSPQNTPVAENAHARSPGLRRQMCVHACMKGEPENGRNHNFGRFRSAPFLPTVLSLRVVGQITGFRCARPRRTLFAGAKNGERGRQRERVRKDTEYGKKDEGRNKLKREREREAEKKGIGR